MGHNTGTQNLKKRFILTHDSEVSVYVQWTETERQWKGLGQGKLLVVWWRESTESREKLRRKMHTCRPHPQ